MSAQQTHVFPAEPGQPESSYYASQLFNELYFLADGGTVWLDSTAGISNQSGADTELQEDKQKQSKQPCADQFQQGKGIIYGWLLLTRCLLLS
jgi:hypothetical protein